MESDSRRPAFGLGSWTDVVWLISMSSTLLLALLPFSSYIASIPFIEDEWGMTNFQAAMVFSAYLVGYAVSSAFLIPVTDRLPAGKVMFASVALIAVSNILFPLLAHDIWSASALRFIAGAGHVGAYIPGIRIVSLRFADGMRGTAVAIFVGAGYAGTTISYVFMGQLLDLADSWRTAYMITALVGLIGVLIALIHLLRHPSEEEAAQSSSGSGRLNISVLRHRPMLLINTAYALHTAELYLARLWLPLLLAASLVHDGKEPGEAAVLAATWSGFMFMTGIVGVFAGGFISDRFGRTFGAAAIFAASGAISFVAGWLVGAPPLILITLGFVYGFATSADSAIYSTAVTELAPRNLIGSTQAIQSFVGFTVGAIAPVIAGGLLDVFDGALGWGAAFGFNGMLAVIGVTALTILRRMPEAVNMAAGKR